MSKLQRISGKKFMVYLRKMGYELVSVKGSHHKFRNAQGKTVVVPLHSNRTMATGTLHYAVTAMMDMTVEEFAEKLREL